jgi:SH3 domain-containing YSC84-like protein 1
MQNIILENKNMKKIFTLFLLFISFTSLFCESRFELNNRIRDSIVLMEKLQDSPAGAIPDEVLDKCYGIAIFPNVVKAGVIIGGMYGEGIMLAKNHNSNTWTPPVFMTLRGASVGIQVGAASMDMVLVIMNKHGIESLSHTNLTLGGDVGVAAGPVGRSAAIEGGISTAILSYSSSKGLFAGMAIKGAIIGPDSDNNHTMYGDVPVREILTGNVHTSKAAELLMQELKKY